MSASSVDEMFPEYDIGDMLSSIGFDGATSWEQEFLEEMEPVTYPSPLQEQKLCEIQQKFWCFYEPMQAALDKD